MALFLPGLGLEEPEEIQTVQTTQHNLSKGCEWRFEVAVGKFVNVKLATGSAEIFGTELVVNNSYTFTGTKAALYTWHGCSIEVSGDGCQSEYTAEETPMNDYINVHFALETLRDKGKAQGREGPRVLILGPENAGKTSLAKILTGYAMRNAKAPVMVNMDSREGVLSIPGTITATMFKTLLDVEEGWGCAPMSGPNGIIPVKLPLVYYYGMPYPEDKDGSLYKALASRMALAVTGRLQQDPEAKEAGIIIDTPGSLTSTKAGGGNVGYDIIHHIVSEFSVTAIICLGSERLYNDIVKRFDNMPIASSNSAQSNQRTVSVIKLAKSGGCVDRDETCMKAFGAAQIRSYFYGNPRLSSGISLGPRSQPVDFSQLSIYRLVGSHEDTDYGGGSGGGEDEFLPGGTDTDDFYGTSNTISSRVPLPASQLYERIVFPHPAMRNCVLVVLNCDAEAEQEELKNSSVMGFLYVVDVDEAKQRLVLLAPVAGRIPGRAIVWGGWPEAVLGLAS